MSVTNQLDTFLFSTLTGATAITDHLADGTAGVWADMAPQNADHPLVVFRQMASTPTWQLNGVAFENLLYDVQTVTIGESTALAGTIDAAISTALDDSSGTVTDYGLLYIRRESGVRFPEVYEGQRINHRGALYRIWLAPE
jgi:hypothetical protein